MMEAIHCIFCNISNNTIAIEENGYCGKKCKKCGLIYISPRPTETEIANLYGHDDAKLSAQLHIDQAYAKRLQARHHLSLLRQYRKKGSLLEIGAGAGYFLSEAKKYGFEPFGIELNPKQASFITEFFKIPCETEPLSSQCFGGRKFDIIYHCDVASHFYNPIGAFTQMFDVLNKDGLLLFETGNIGDIKSSYYKLFKQFQYPDHLFFFSESNLYTLLEKAGFKIIKLYQYSIVPQLLFNRFIHLLKKQDSRKNDLETIPKRNGKKSFFKRNIKYVYDHFQHILRYKIGRCAIKKNSPKTLIILAYKKK